MIIDTKEYKSVICLDGDLPFDFLQKTDLEIIATDGAANKLLQNNIHPLVVIGDLDSINEEVRSHCNCIEIASQNSTDYEKALDYASDNNLFPSIITGINGGYLDRILMNLCIFSQTDSVFFSEDMIGMVISKHKVLHLPKHTKISLMGANEAVVTSHGLKWELKETRLSFAGFCSCSNRVSDETVTLDVDGEILVFIYLKDIIDSGK